MLSMGPHAFPRIKVMVVFWKQMLLRAIICKESLHKNKVFKTLLDKTCLICHLYLHHVLIRLWVSIPPTIPHYLLFSIDTSREFSAIAA